MTKVAKLTKHSNNGLHFMPEDTLKDALKCIGEKGALKNGKKLIFIALDDTEGNYDTNWFQCGMKISECVALCEVAKSRFLEEMGY